MNTFRKKLHKSSGGFTLVELMVVVAIIGILSAVAIPNFKKYQAKAKTSEAKLALSAMYSAEIALITDYDSYATCLDVGGYQPTGVNTAGTGNTTGARRYYRVGFKSTQAKTTGASLPAGTVCDKGAFKSFWVHTKLGSGGVAPADADIASTAPSTVAFTVGAAAGISNVRKDKWTIDQDKRIQHTQIGY